MAWVGSGFIDWTLLRYPPFHVARIRPKIYPWVGWRYFSVKICGMCSSVPPELPDTCGIQEFLEHILYLFCTSAVLATLLCEYQKERIRWTCEQSSAGGTICHPGKKLSMPGLRPRGGLTTTRTIFDIFDEASTPRVYWTMALLRRRRTSI